MATPFQITVDCQDADVMTRFWSIALGYVEEPPPEGHESWTTFLEAQGIDAPTAGTVGSLVDPDGVGPRLFFLQVPEAKTVKNRWHLDLRAGRSDDARQAKITELIAAGATEIGRVDEHGGWWMVMTDPEGNEFCVT